MHSTNISTISLTKLFYMIPTQAELEKVPTKQSKGWKNLQESSAKITHEIVGRKNWILKIKYYIRYADDFVVLYNSLDTLLHCFKTVKQFVDSNLLLNIHPDKITIRKLIWGIDFCGYIVLLHYVQIKTKTKRRIFKKVSSQNISYQSLQSYLGYFSHAKSYKISQELKNHFYLKTEAHLLTQAPYFARIHIDF